MPAQAGYGPGETVEGCAVAFSRAGRVGRTESGLGLGENDHAFTCALGLFVLDGGGLGPWSLVVLMLMLRSAGCEDVPAGSRRREHSQ